MNTEANPFDLPSAIATRSLLRQRQYLAGELLKAERGRPCLVAPAEATRRIRAIDEVLVQLGCQVCPESLQPKRRSPRLAVLPHGGLRRGILAVLRKANDWLTVEEVVQQLLTLQDIDLDDERRKRFKQKAREALHALRSRDLVQREEALGFSAHQHRQQRWRLNSAVFGKRPTE